MKPILKILLIIIPFTASFRLSAQVLGKFGTNQSMLNANSVLEIESLSKGVLLPRLNTVQQNAMSSPPDGMLIYNTDSACFVLRRAGVWRSLCAANGGEAWSTLGNAGTNANTNFLGTTDYKDLVFRTNNTEKARLTADGYWGLGSTNPVSRMHVINPSGWDSGNDYVFDDYSSGTTGSTIYLRRARGTQATPLSVATGDTLGRLAFDPYQSGAFSYSGGTHISSVYRGNGTNSKTNFMISTSNMERMVIDENGNTGLGIATPQYKLDIDAQTGSSGNPLRLLGLNVGATSDSILSSASGVLRRLSINQVIANAWNITGNTGTNANTHFLGTTDAQDLVFKTAGIEGMRILSSNRYVGIGIATPLQPLDIVVNNPAADNIHLTSYGTNPSPTLRLRAAQGTAAAPTFIATGTTIGSWINAVTTGVANGFADATSIRSYATEAHSATGFGANMVFYTVPNASTLTTEAMRIESNGYVGIGTLAVPNQQLEITQSFRFPATTSSTTGVIYKGASSFIHNYKPSANDGNNTFLGINAGNFTMASGTSWLASGNTGLGSSVLNALTTGGFNTASGINALTLTTTGSYNAALGSFALAANLTGNGNTAVGHNALASNIAGSNTAIGNAALNTNTTGTLNVAIGESVLRLNTTGNSNTAVGQASMEKNTTGTLNTALGTTTMHENLTGVSNVAMGSSALYTNIAGNYNVVMGESAFYTATSSNNVAIGYIAGTATTTGANVTFLGYQAGAANTTGGSNTFIGNNTGLTNTTGSNNTMLGATANLTANNFSNSTAIGFGASVNASNKIRLGNASVTVVETSGSFVTVSDKRLKTNINENLIGLDFIKAVRPVHYELKAQKGIVYDGFIAQEVDSILQKQGIKSFSGVVKPSNTEGGYYTVSYATFVVPLVNAVKELDAKSEKLKMKNEKLVADNEQLKIELEKLKKDNTTLRANVEKNSQDIELIKAALNRKQN